MFRITKVAIPLFVLALCTTADASGFLKSNASLTAAGLEVELNHAVESALGCGGEASHARERFAEIQSSLMPMWEALPKNQYGKIERRSLRYVAHRHFMRSSSIMIRGFEPLKVLSDSHSGAADVLSQRVPIYVEKVLEGRKAVHGFSLADATTMVAIVEQLIFDSENAVLEASYKQMNTSHSATLNHAVFAEIMEVYLVHWMMGDDHEGIRILMSSKKILEKSFPQWKALKSFASGQIKALEYARQQKPRLGRGVATFSQRYTFEDAHEVAGGITKSFASFWESECVSMKDQLVDMDPDADGRVPLSQFYGKGIDTEWRFGESEANLRELGALDETSIWKGKQVIIPNYLQAASNCIVSTPHYLVCCAAECEAFLGDIEAAVGAPMAAAADILSIVGNMSSVSASLNYDETPTLVGALTAQLKRVAAAHGGKVPLHSRLFSQWLHYVFPRECPFPHKAGAATSTTPTEYGGSYIASKEEMANIAYAPPSNESASASTEADELHSQWSEEEEFFADYGHELVSSPFGGPGCGSFMLLGVTALILGVVLYLKGKGSKGREFAVGSLFDSSDKMLKSHMV